MCFERMSLATLRRLQRSGVRTQEQDASAGNRDVQVVTNDGVDLEDRADSGLPEGRGVKYETEKSQKYRFRLDG